MRIKFKIISVLYARDNQNKALAKAKLLIIVSLPFVYKLSVRLSNIAILR